jgi:hypothetical protein
MLPRANASISLLAETILFAFIFLLLDFSHSGTFRSDAESLEVISASASCVPSSTHLSASFFSFFFTVFDFLFLGQIVKFWSSSRAFGRQNDTIYGLPSALGVA